WRHLKRLTDERIDIGWIEATTGFEAQAFHPGELGLIGCMRRVHLQQLGGVGKVGVRRHFFDLLHRWRFHVYRAVNLGREGLRFLAPLREQCNFAAILHLVYGIVILRAVGPGSANDPDERGRSTNSLESLGQLTLPARSNHDKITGARAGRALSHPSERISP